MTRKRSRLFPVALLLVLVLIVAAGGAVYYFIFRPAASTVPTVLIHSPRDGTRLDVGQELIVHSSARDDRKVQRVELWVDGKLEHSESSTVPGGTSPFPILARWQPTSPGTHTLTVRAFNAQGGRGHASVKVEAASIADRDRDGVSDAEDACPDQAGSAATNGCPDRDGDGVADVQDNCPDQAGVAASSGCPAPTLNDRDGDGVVDSSDACPDQAGTVRTGGCPDADGDGVADAADACPGEAGLPERSGCPAPGDTDGDGVADAADACPGDPGPASTGGCPDGDGDGVADREDACPDEAGLPALGGCPDRDGDGVRDSADLCPDVPGPASNGGCPVTGVGDRDGDGIADDVDLCPDEAGTAEHGGCPPPGEGADDDHDGTADSGEVADDSGMDIGPLFFHLFQGYANVEVQALEFQTGHAYDLVHCYVSLAGGETNRYGPFDSLGANYWDIAELLGGANSARLLVSRSEPLGVDVECGGETVDLGPEGGSGTYYDMGTIAARHPDSMWDGRVITSERSTGGDDGHWFEAKYRICSPSCESTALQAPMVHLISGGGDTRLVWYYAGNRDEITGFNVYVNGSSIGYIGPDRYSLSVAAHGPPCGETFHYQLTAYHLDPDGVIGESPPSNEAHWTAAACPHRVRVSFETIRTGGDWGAVEEYVADSKTGPIYGSFFANEQQLQFDMADTRWALFVPYPDGQYLSTNSVYNVDELFTMPDIPDLIGCAGSDCPPFSAPAVDYLIVNLGPYDDLTIGGRIYDYDVMSEDDTRFDDRLVLPAEMIDPGLDHRYTMTNGNITLTVRVEVLED